MVYTLLKNIEFFSFINNLFYLLSGSFLVSIIEENSLDYLISLEVLNLQSNKISFLDEHLFVNMVKIKELNLSHNNIINIKSTIVILSNLQSLKFVDFNYNYLDGYNDFGFRNLDFKGDLCLEFNYLVRHDRRGSSMLSHC